MIRRPAAAAGSARRAVSDAGCASPVRPSTCVSRSRVRSASTGARRKHRESPVNRDADILSLRSRDERINADARAPCLVPIPAGRRRNHPPARRTFILDRARPRQLELQPRPHPGTGGAGGGGDAGGEERRLRARTRPRHRAPGGGGHPLGDGRQAAGGRAAAHRRRRVRGAGDGRPVHRRAVRSRRRAGTDDGGVHRGGGAQARCGGTPPGTDRAGVREGRHRPSPGRRAP